MTHALIIGASRGIGQEFVRQYLAQGAKVTATARSAEAIAALTHAGATALHLDMLNADAGTAISGVARNSIDVAIINAGVFGPRAEAPIAPSQADFDYVMQSNVLGPMRLLAGVSGALKDGGKLAIVSSRMGSIGGRVQSAGWLYRASKAAVNSVAKDAAITLAPRGIAAIAFHPGWVRTDMGGANADLDVSESVAGMIGVMSTLTLDGSGRFVNYDGSEIPW